MTSSNLENKPGVFNLSKSKFNIKYFNARSLRDKLPSLHSVLYCGLYDVVCVTETWLNAVYSDSLLDPKSAYHIYRCDRQSLHPSGGVCIFVSR